MIASLAILLAYLAPVALGTPAESQAAIRAFREGCTDGSLRLSADRGVMIAEAEAPEYVKLYTPGWINRKYVRFIDPADTYLVLAEMQRPGPRGFTTLCYLASKRVSAEDAVKALVETAPEVEPRQTWVPSMYFPEWTVDLPKRGYRKRLAIRRDGTVILEVAMYKPQSQ